MLTNQKLQNTLDEIREISRMETALYSIKGQELAHTQEFAPTSGLDGAVVDFIDSEATMKLTDSYGFYQVMADGEPGYVLVAREEEEAFHVCAQMAVCQIRNLAAGSAEKFDRNRFIQNILLGNMLLVDIQTKAKKHHIQDVPRTVFVIDMEKKHSDLAMELVKNLMDMRAGDFVTSIDGRSIVLVKDISHLKTKDYEEAFAGIASSLVDNLQAEAMVRVRVGWGSVVKQLPEIVQSYQEARLALEVGRIFYAQRETISYGKLGIGRLIYQIPTSLCRMFIKEVFGDEIPEILEDEEAMSTINKFFENNLNISETARQLYVHRNTLVYRLERIEKAIGLDIRTFDDAMTFRIALMVIAQMKDKDNENGES
jgi:carbohydrate diacid regulator